MKRIETRKPGLTRRRLITGVVATALARPLFVRAQGITPYPNAGDTTEARGQTPVPPAQFVDNDGRGLVVIHTGQSLPANFSTLTPYTPWTGKVFEFCGNTGVIYPSDGGPVRGTNGYAGRLSILPYQYEMAVLRGLVDWVLMVVTNVGGTSAGDWSRSGHCFPRILSVLQQLAALGIRPNYWFHEQGQEDVHLQTTASVYADNFIDMMQGIRANGYEGSVVFETGAYWPNFSDVNPTAYRAVLQGQRAGISACGVSAGFNDDTLASQTYRVGPHWNDNGREYKVQGVLPTIPKLAV